MFGLGGVSDAQAQALVNRVLDKKVREIIRAEIRAVVMEERTWLLTEMSKITARMQALERVHPETFTASVAQAPSIEPVEKEGQEWIASVDLAVAMQGTSSQAPAQFEESHEGISEESVEESSATLDDLACALLPPGFAGWQRLEFEDEDDGFQSMPPESYFSFCWAKLLRHKREGTSPTGTICRLSLAVFIEYFFAWSYLQQMEPWVNYAEPPEDATHTACMYQQGGLFPKVFNGKPTLIYAASFVSIIVIALSMKSDDEEITHTMYCLDDRCGITCAYLTWLWRMRTMFVVPFVGCGVVMQMVQNQHIQEVLLDSVGGCFLLELDDLFYKGLINNHDKFEYQNSKDLDASQLRRSIGAVQKLSAVNTIGLVGMYATSSILLFSNLDLKVGTLLYCINVFWTVPWIVCRSLIIDEFEYPVPADSTCLSKFSHALCLFGMAICTALLLEVITEFPFYLAFQVDDDVWDRLNNLRQCVLSNQTSCSIRDYLCGDFVDQLT